MARDNLSIAESGGRKRVPSSPGAQRAKAELRRYLASSSARSRLDASLVRKLGDIKSDGNELLNSLRPYSGASVFLLEFSSSLYGKQAETPGAKGGRRPGAAAEESLRASLDAAKSVLMKGRFVEFPKSDPDLEATMFVSALFFIGAASRYCPDLIIESKDGAEEKADLARGFITFYDERIAGLISKNVKWQSPQAFHAECYRAYLDLKEDFPALFDQLRSRLWTSRGELMAPFGKSGFAVSWRELHYSGGF